MLLQLPAPLEQWSTSCAHSLNGRTHMVYTGVALVHRGEGGDTYEHCFHKGTQVTFASLTEEVIQSYVDSGEPLWVDLFVKVWTS